jgi:hypothetical protein
MLDRGLPSVVDRDQPAGSHDRDAVGNSHDLPEVGRHHQDGRAAVTIDAQQLVDLRLRSDVNANRRLVEQQNVGPPMQPFP